MSKLRIADKYWIERPYQYAFKTFQVYFCSWLQKAFLNSISFYTFSLELITREYSLHKEQFSVTSSLTVLLSAAMLCKMMATGLLACLVESEQVKLCTGQPYSDDTFLLTKPSQYIFLLPLIPWIEHGGKIFLVTWPTSGTLWFVWWPHHFKFNWRSEYRLPTYIVPSNQCDQIKIAKCL